MATATATQENAPLEEGDEQLFKCIYFGFASNISPRSLQQRCPGAIFIGAARLRGWKFIISEIGFGNIVPGDDTDEVYGSLHFLTAQHEAALDKSEEVPDWHIKKTFKVEGIQSNGMVPAGQALDVMTYVDLKRTTEGIISKEYIFLMRKAIVDATQIGVPASYFDKCWSKYIPEDTVGTQEQVIMVRTIQMDKEDDKSYVPKKMF